MIDVSIAGKLLQKIILVFKYWVIIKQFEDKLFVYPPPTSSISSLSCTRSLNIVGIKEGRLLRQISQSVRKWCTYPDYFF